MEAAVDMHIYQNSTLGQRTQTKTAEQRDDRYRREHRLFIIVAASFGLLCILQVTLNIYLRHAGRSCPQGWQSFGFSCYYISASHINWTASRAECHKMDAELVIISSQEEQAFIKALSVRTWIGLSYNNKTESWNWVDGTPLTTGYWSPGEPNGWMGKPENCAEIWSHDQGLECWNDESCDFESHSICKRAP